MGGNGFFAIVYTNIKMDIIVGYENFISAVPTLTFVFIFSTKKVFKNKVGLALKTVLDKLK